MNSPSFDFNRKAREEMIHEGFQPDFPPQVVKEVAYAQAAPVQNAVHRDMRGLLWSSIDNTQSRDLDQVEWVERLSNGNIRVLVGIADVDSVVTSNSATDARARANATSVYTGGPVFPMLPERLSTDLTSLSQDADRRAIIMEFVVSPGGDVVCAEVCAAVLRNKAKLNYNQVAAWLGGATAPSLPSDLREQLFLQQEASQRLKKFRIERGALTFGGVESIPLIVNNSVHGFDQIGQSASRDIIESFMIAANVSMAQFLRRQNFLCLRRIVRTPKRWDRIQAISAEAGTKLPDAPDSKALGDFLAAQKQSHPDTFPELSLAVLKALGPGEYVVEHPGSEHEGHFGLAVDDYTHSTAPNRRYADLIMQRLLKAAIQKQPRPLSEAQLSDLAAHCTERETAARHVERFMKKVAAAILLAPQVGKTFDAIVTGASNKGTFARLLAVPAEGRILHGEKGLDVGDKTRVKLISVDPQKGFVDFDAAR
ncbi:MAG TPA: RNB domain-containing ribonuclease [Verrucomicrobiae bacterium]|nr:RNB domain-containing ribonuclease [Verrucomicrobiae bacterium]